MKSFLFQTLFFIVLAQSAGLVLNVLWLKDPLAELVIESLIAGITSSIVYAYFSKSYLRKQQELTDKSSTR